MRVVLLCLILFLISCNQITINQESEEMNLKKEAKIMEKDISLNVKIREEKDSLILEYEACNRSDSTIYLMNHLCHVEESGVIHPDRNLVYIYPEKNNNTIHLAKWAPPVPNDLLIEEICPYIAILQKGEKYKEELKLELPLKPFVPYLEDEYETDKWKTVIYDNICFTLGFYRHTENIQIIHKNIGGVAVIDIGGIPSYGKGQQLLESEKIELPLKVLMPK